VLLLGHLQVSSAASQTIAEIPQLHSPIFFGFAPFEKIVTSQGMHDPWTKTDGNGHSQRLRVAFHAEISGLMQVHVLKSAWPAELVV
jgi:hypothetical protein